MRLSSVAVLPSLYISSNMDDSGRIILFLLKVTLCAVSMGLVFVCLFVIFANFAGDTSTMGTNIVISHEFIYLVVIEQVYNDSLYLVIDNTIQHLASVVKC